MLDDDTGCEKGGCRYVKPIEYERRDAVKRWL